ncbi:hypothetical protein AVEN_66229-1 [Araneus ventricosus]|uniref:ribonuclease H n=1 Tax=Araneus ventricosus TaxID=182803 RepID=A0A4Y2T0P0_ARAVE|nr:hypothetical protein AVEN_66229-1 [Araneus ventricosus]
MPLHLRRRKLGAQYYFRIQSHSNHPVRTLSIPVGLGRLYAARTSNILPFCERMKRYLGDLDISTVQVYHIDFFSFPPWDVPQFSFLNPFSKFDKSTTNPVVFQQIFLSHRTQFCTYSPIFTDGSKTASRVGCGIVFDQNVFSRRLNASCSVLTAELMAIWLALEKVFTLPENTFCIYSVSLSALETLAHPQTSIHPIVSEILCLVTRLKARDCEILFCWIPSHVGIHGNELADTFAKSASTDLNHQLPYADIKKSLLIYVHSLWQESWDQQIHNKLHSIQQLLKLRPVVPVRMLDVKLNRLRIGHTRLTHKYLLFGERCPACTTCHVNLTVHHILVECPVFSNHRSRFFISVSLNIRDLA